VGHATTVRAGLVTRRGKRGSYARPQPEAFYQLGPLQLWVLDALLSDDAMRELTAALGRSPGPSAPRGTVFASFQAIVRAALRDANVRGIAVAVSARVDSLVLAEPRGARPAGAAYERALAASVLRQDASERVSLAPGDEEDLSNYQAESWWMGVGDTSAPSRRWRFSAAFERYTSGVLTFRLDTLVERRRRAPPFESVTADSVAVRGLGAIERFATRCRFGAYGTDERIAGVVRDSTPDRWMQPRIAFFIDTVASRIRRMRADLLACRLAPNPD
jgi:hypothetical protein